MAVESRQEQRAWLNTHIPCPDGQERHMNDLHAVASQPQTDLQAGLITAGHEARLLGIHHQTLLEKARLGLVPGVKIRRRWRFSHPAVLAALAAIGYPLPAPGAFAEGLRDTQTARTVARACERRVSLPATTTGRRGILV
jgi:hypothetical protein